MGTPDFAKESLEKIIDSGYEVVGVVTPPDRPKGRGMKMIACPVKEYAIEKNIKVFQPEKIVNNKEFKTEIKNLDVDLFVVVSYGKILPKSFLEIPKKGAINVHPSLLPKYRGSAPIQWAILNGDENTGVTIMYMNEKMDAGDIILQKEVKIDEDETTGELWNRLSTIGAEMLLESIENIENESVTRTAQPEDFTLASMIEKSMAKIDFDAFEVEIEVEVELMYEKQGLYVKSLDGIISVLEIQGENSRKMNISDYLRGNKINVGLKFE